jgi:hypothetical protein
MVPTAALQQSRSAITSKAATSCRGIGRVLADGWLVEGTRMAQPARQQHTLTEQEEQRIAEEAKAIQKQDTEPERQGDVLGLSDASPAVEIPRATDDRSGNPAVSRCGLPL